MANATQQLNTTLAALRYWQLNRMAICDSPCLDIEADNDVGPMTDAEIDDLYESLNCGEILIVPCGQVRP